MNELRQCCIAITRLFAFVASNHDDKMQLKCSTSTDFGRVMEEKSERDRERGEQECQTFIVQETVHTIENSAQF